MNPHHTFIFASFITFGASDGPSLSHMPYQGHKGTGKWESGHLDSCNIKWGSLPSSPHTGGITPKWSGRTEVWWTRLRSTIEPTFSLIQCGWLLPKCMASSWSPMNLSSFLQCHGYLTTISLTPFLPLYYQKKLTSSNVSLTSFVCSHGMLFPTLWCS